jgi:FixJ family two-component response regulator
LIPNTKDRCGGSSIAERRREVLAGKPLSRRKQQVCAFVALGRLNKEIATDLNLSPNSVTQY